MSEFDAENGFLHFVFANGKDSYYTDSLMSMDYKSYLYYRLKKKKYKNILWIYKKENRDEYEVEFFDKSSGHLYERERRIYYSGIKTQKNEENTASDRLIKLIERARNTAYIFNFRSFQALFYGNEERLKEILKKKNNTSIALIKGWTDADRNTKILMREKSVYKNKEIFPELVNSMSLENINGESCFEKLKKLYGKRCCFLNDFCKERLIPVLQYALWKQYTLKDYSEEDILDAAEFISAWYRSVDMKERFPDCLRKNRRRMFSLLEEDIEKKWPILKENMESWKAQKERYRILEETHIYANNAMTQKFDSIYMPQRVWSIRPIIGHQWLMLDRVIHTPLIPIEDVAVLKEPIEILNKAETAVFEENWERLFKLEEALLAYLTGKSDLEEWKTDLEEKKEQTSVVDDEKLTFQLEEYLKVMEEKQEIQ